MTALTPRRRLTRSADFDAVYRRGRSRSTRHLVVYVFPREGLSAGGEGAARIGITVPKKIGGAVVRNRVKRQLREAMTSLGSAAAPNADIVLVARPGIAEAIDNQGMPWLVEELRPLAAAEGMS